MSKISGPGDTKSLPPLFAEHLVHQFSLANKQCEAGLYVIKRLASFLTKVARNQKDFATNTFVATKKEKEKIKIIRADAMFRHVVATTTVTDVIEQFSGRMNEFANQIEESVIKPLSDFYLRGDRRRKALCQQEELAKQELKVMQENLIKERKECLKSWKKLCEVKIIGKPDEKNLALTKKKLLQNLADLKRLDLIL